MVLSNPKLESLLEPKLTKYIPHSPTPKQSAFLWLTGLDVFYGGAAGGGKSDALLMAALQYVDVPGYNAILIRNTYANLSKPDGLMDRADEWLNGTDARWEGSDKRWRFPSGATLSFGYLDGPRDHYNYQGPAYQFVGIDELVQIRERQALYMFSRLRKKMPKSYYDDLKKLKRFRNFTEEELQKFYFAYNQLPLRFRGTSNPPQKEQLERGFWVKNHYIDPNLKEKESIFIPAGLDDNPHLNKDEYLKSMEFLDPITREQLVKGNWDISEKGELFDRTWFKLVDREPSKIIESIRYWDLAGTEEEDGKEPAYTVGLRMNKCEGNLIYIDSIIRFRKTARYIEQIVRQTADMDGIETAISMEQEPGSSGKNLIDHYRRNILPEFNFKEDKVTGSKYKRSQPYASQAEAGNVYILKAPWTKDYLDELEMFPNSAFKDQVDCSSGGFNKLFGGKVETKIRII